MNKPIRVVAVFCLVLFMALLVNSTYLMYVRAGDLAEDPRNRRVLTATYSRERGAILVGDEAIARSVPSNDKYHFQRTYSEPFKYAPVTGYFAYFSQTGVERSQNPVLSGDDSRLFVTRLVDMLSNGDPKGGNVQLTLDAAAQDAAWNGLEALPGDAQGAVVALEPTTGRVLAMASTPSYDPNVLASHDFGAVTEASERLNEDPREPLINRTIGTTLPPGSTFKLVTAAAAIESGDYDADSMVPGGFRYQLPQSSTTIGNYDGGNCGGRRITMTQALQVSCNVTFLSLANELGTEAMAEQAEAFGFNSTSLEDLAGQAQSLYPRDMDAPQTAMSGIGQSSVTATPLQMAMVAAAIANDGDVMRPYVVDEVRAPEPVGARPHRPRDDQQGDLEHHRRRAHPDDGRHGRLRHRHPGADPGRRGRRQDRHGAVERPTVRPTRGSSPSPRPTTRRSRSRCSCSPATPRPTRSPAAPSADRSPRRSWRR